MPDKMETLCPEVPDRDTILSVCMATCNGSRFIRAQLESILPQLGPDDELIVSDDGSTDDTTEIVRGYGDPRIRLLTGNRFSSPVRNFEHALDHARGRIIVLSDQDDIWFPGRLALVHQHLDSEVDRVSLIMMDGEIIDADGVCSGASIFDVNCAGAGILKNVFDNTYSGCCLAFTRALLEIALPFPGRIPMHDMWLGLLAEIFGRVEFVPVRTIGYRRHAANTSFIRSSVYRQISRRLSLVLSLTQRCCEVRCIRKRNP
jgi:glycosyltransferase involved in cell wall biosynthesis